MGVVAVVVLILVLMYLTGLAGFSEYRYNPSLIWSD